MYCHSFLVTSVRGMGDEPTTFDSWALGCIGFMKAGLGARLVRVFFFAARLGALLRARVFFFAADFFRVAFLEPFFAAFFLVAMDALSWWV
jgi:hypothetical protein